MHILLFYQYYHNPDCAASGRHYQFIKHLCKNHQVSIITSDVWQHKRQSNNFEWAPPGTTIRHLSVPYNNAMGNKARLKAYAGFMVKAIRAGLSVKKPDIIIGTSTPLSAAWAAAQVARIKGVPWIFEVQDLWPDFPVQMGALKNTWIRKKLYNMEHNLYRNASHIIPLSPDMEAHILSKDIPQARVTTLVNGTDPEFANQVTPEEVAQLRATHNLGDRKIILYAGTLGRANAIPLILKASQQLAHRSDLAFVILGSGYFMDEVQQAAEKQNNIVLAPALARHEVFRWFKAASLSLVTFINKPVLATNSPAKFFDSLVSGTPVIVTNPGWTREFVETHTCGWYVNPEEPEALVRGIEDAIDDPQTLAQAGLNGAKIAAQLFDRSKMAIQLENILQSYV